MSTRDASHRSGRAKPRIEPTPTTFSRLQARGERLLQWFPELRKTWQRDGEPGLEALLAQLQSLGGEMSRRAQETGRGLEARAERVLADLERQAVRGLSPLLSRANLASGSEVTTLEDRLAHLEARVEPMLADRDQLAGRVGDLQRELSEARAEVTERLREVTVRAGVGDELRDDLAATREHVEVVAKEHATRSLDLGKLQDRLVRLEMRLGDILKEHGTIIVGQQDLGRRLAALDAGATESARGTQGLRDQLAAVAADGRCTESRVNAMVTARASEHDELARLGDVLSSIQQTLRQVDLRLGDLGERYSGIREELSALGARVSQLELAPTRSVGSSVLGERAEGH